MAAMILILVAVLFVGGLPTWRHSKGWGYAPSGTMGALLLIVLVFVLLGYIPRDF